MNLMILLGRFVVHTSLLDAIGTQTARCNEALDATAANTLALKPRFPANVEESTLKALTLLKIAITLFVVAGVAIVQPVEAATLPGMSLPAGLPAGLKASIRRTVVTDTGGHNLLGSLAWLEQPLNVDDGAYLDAYGWSIAVQGTTALVGAYFATIDSEQDRGAVYVFTESDGIWTQTQKLVASDGAMGDSFGTAVALDGDTALVGAPAVAIGNQQQQGQVYVFNRSGGIWTEVQKLLASDGAQLSEFGISVALQGGTSMIGADGNGISRGAVYVFHDLDGIWTEAQELTASDGVAQDLFGQQVVFDGDTALIGATQATYANNFPGHGATYVFTADATGVWSQQQRLGADDGVDADYFGRWAALAGDQLLIGAPAVNGFQGAVYAFARRGGAWSQTQKLFAADGLFFGDAVAMTASTALIGAPATIVDEQPYAGAAYLYQLVDGTWTPSNELMPSDARSGGYFGYVVALRDDITALVGAPHFIDDGSGVGGAAYVYTAPADDTIFVDGFDSTTP